MALKALVKDLNDVATEYQGLYVKNEDGTFRLDAEGVEDVTGLKTALGKERERANNADKLRKEVEGKFDPKKYEALLALEKQIEEDKEKTEREKLKGNPDWEAREKALLEKHDKHVKNLTDQFGTKFGDLETRLKVTTQALHRELIDSAATTAIAGEKGVPEILLPHVRNSCRVLEENGTFRVEVVDGQGNARMSTDPKSTAPMSIKEFVGEMKESNTFGRVFEGTGSSGMGSRSSGGNPGPNGAFTLRRSDATDLRKYESAKAAAEKAGATLQIID